MTAKDGGPAGDSRSRPEGRRFELPEARIGLAVSRSRLLSNR
jgi:hypothetical protein